MTSRRGLWMALTRAGLFRLRGAADAKNWRPHLLVLSGAPTRRWYMVAFADWLSHRRALVTVASVLTDESVTLDRQRAMESTIRRLPRPAWSRGADPTGARA